MALRSYCPILRPYDLRPCDPTIALWSYPGTFPPDATLSYLLGIIARPENAATRLKMRQRALMHRRLVNMFMTVAMQRALMHNRVRDMPPPTGPAILLITK